MTGPPRSVPRGACVAVYATGHGLGHAARLALVVEEIFARAPDARVAIRGRAPAFLFREWPGLERSEVEADFGVRQPDGLTIDHRSTLADLRELAAGFEERIRVEVDWLRAVGASIVLADVPPLAFAAAERAGIPGIALANFSWDWIYRELSRERPEYEPFAELAAAAYRSAVLCLRLPFHGDMSAFRALTDVPLVTRRATATRGEAKHAFGLAPERPAVLLSFGGFAFPSAAQERLAHGREFDLIVTNPPTRPFAGIRVAPSGFDFAELLRAVDAVVTKPGWGLFAGCLVNGTRVLYAGRDGFPESPVLAEAIERLGTATQVAQEKVLAGDVASELHELLARPATESAPAADGAAVVAERVLSILAETRA